MVIVARPIVFQIYAANWAIHTSISILNRKTCEVAALPVFSHTRDQSHFSPGVCALGPTTWVKMSVFRNLDVGKGSFKPGDLPLLTELLIILEITGLSQISQLPQRDGQHRKIKVPGGL